LFSATKPRESQNVVREDWWLAATFIFAFVKFVVSSRDGERGGEREIERKKEIGRG
jgi:hypothetical protein